MAKKNPSTPVEAILGTSPAEAEEVLATLTAREREVAEKMAAGLSNGKIAEELKISSKTLDVHRGKVQLKLRAKTAVAVARIVFAQKFGEHLK